MLAGAKSEWIEVQLTHEYIENSHGLGVCDMARALLEGGTPRPSGDLANHVLYVMYATIESSAADRLIHLSTTTEHPEPMSGD